ncbi:hypothetical protein MY4038_010039 [Beauveria bassiana]
MRYHVQPRGFRWSLWKDLWHNNLPDLKTTKKLSPTTIFVAIDTEPWPGQARTNSTDEAAAQIGIALLAPPADHAGKIDEPPQTLEEAQQRFHISSHSIHINGRERMGLGEIFWKGGDENVAFVGPDEVEDTVLNLVHTFQQQMCLSLGKPLKLTLVGFDLYHEFRILSRHYTRILDCFTSWVDVQELAKELMPDTSQAPSLRNTLIGVGYEPIFPTKPASSDGHDAGNDAMRCMSVLGTLLHYSPPGEHLARAHSEYHANRCHERSKAQRAKANMQRRDLFSNECPWPAEKYPFRAKVDLPGTYITKWQDPAVLCEYFLKYKPVAAGGNNSKTFGGWICFASLEELELFLREIDGMEDVEGRGTWLAKTRYNPNVVQAVTKAELDEYLREKAAAEIAEKRRIRQEKKQREEIYG